MSKSFEELRLTGRLPSPPGVGMAILRLTQAEDCAIRDIARAIASDPALTGRVLKLANCSRAATMAPVASIDEAVNRLGFRSIRVVALGFSLISEYRDGTCAGFDFPGFWSASLARAVAAQSIAHRRCAVVPAEAYCAGLLAHIGRLALACVHPAAYSRILAEAGAGDADEVRRLERGAFDIDNCDVTEVMLADWGMPSYLTSGIGAYLRRDFPELETGSHVELGRILSFSDALAAIVVDHEKATPEQWREFDAWAARFGLTSPEASLLANEVVAEWKSWGRILDLPTAALPSFEDIERPHAGGGVVATEQIVATGEEAQKRLTILAVDDERLSLRLLVHHLEAAGHLVMRAVDGREALQIALERNPEVIVSDWKMPEMDGLELTRALRRYEVGRAMYVIILTGSGEEERIVEAFDAGIDDYVTKPFNPRVLLARVRAGERVVRLQEQVAADKQVLKQQMTKLAVLNRRLERVSITDPLTGLMNRRYAMERLRESWAAAKRTKRPLSLVMIDIDHFKKVNDVYGHAAGDLVLKETAMVFRKAVREEESICRIGGEEFLVILPEATLEDARRCAERIRSSIEAHRIVGEGYDGHVTVSLGVSSTETVPDAETFEELLAAADKAAYVAKREGRNQTRSLEIPRLQV